MHHDKPTSGIIKLYSYVEHSFETDPTEWVQVSRWVPQTNDNIQWIKKEFLILDNKDNRPFVLLSPGSRTIALFRHRLPDDSEDILCGYGDAFLNKLRICKRNKDRLQQISVRNLTERGE